MSGKLPYLAQPGTLLKILSKIKEAKTPDRFTYDFLETKLGCRGGNYKQFIPLAKKLKLLNPDGSPTDLYKKFRNESTSGAAMAVAIKNAYREIFDRNEFANELDKEKFKGLIVEITGLESKNNVVQLIQSTFEKLKSFANFDAKLHSLEIKETENVVPEDKEKEIPNDLNNKDYDLKLSYTINLVLPKTDDPAVFNAIFRSLKENLLKK